MSAASTASTGAASRSSPHSWVTVSFLSSVSSSRDISRAALARVVCGLRSSIGAQLPRCREASTSRTRPLFRRASSQARLTESVDLPTPPLLLTIETTRPSFLRGSSLRTSSRSSAPCSSVTTSGRRRKSCTCARIASIRTAPSASAGPRLPGRYRATTDASGATAWISSAKVRNERGSDSICTQTISGRRVRAFSTAARTCVAKCSTGRHLRRFWQADSNSPRRRLSLPTTRIWGVVSIVCSGLISPAWRRGRRRAGCFGSRNAELLPADRRARRSRT